MSKLSGKSLFYAHLTEYLDDSLSPDLAKEIKTYADQPQGSEDTDKFQKTRGWLQMELQQLYLSEDEILKLRRLIGSKEERINIEETNISQIDRSVFWTKIKRNATFLIITLAIIAITVQALTTKKAEKFDPLQYVEYEALGLENAETNKLNFPTSDRAEVVAFFEKSPQIKEKPTVLNPFGGGWKIEGASFIDYETAIMSVIQYGRENEIEKLFHFSYKGKLSDLPKTPVGEVSGFKYQTYASEKLNLIAWENKEKELVYMLVGHRAAEELARYVKTGMSK
ncbi:hypothetical protein MEO40_20555 [Dolichospermum sp. ST_sed1]|nr:hypothetical protein [Dolichospermum sp. ST_sed1]